MTEQHWEEMASSEQSYQRQANKPQRGKGATQGRNDKVNCTTGPGQALSPVTSPPVAMTTHSFVAFDTPELWKDYWSRLQKCMEANSIPTDCQPKVFLTNQSKTTFKLISTLAAQMATPKEIENLTMEEILAFMDEQYNSRKLIVQERFRFWS